ncbi:TPA: DUF4433 domain-containing protein [Pseudomonas aeruginosa]|nr:DUF4433 domain-containing protein [Pseudomonas aeruginosa]EJA2567539.1 DUF4433 domain-containing protein [Pseudomonas aeruginosa]EKL8564353.1 DUF4433 domain-containing protein [Pseudomonas aeruginosa]MBH8997289.1 DUF4433 domain-containing protein [Pseudomonas aeruginosa]OTI03802.1 hypothetical protein CAZ17_22360 [Pseudomonas aeruginosa]
MNTAKIAKSSELMLSMLDGMAPMSGLPPCLYYMMPLENFQRVRKHGLVSRSTAMEQGLHVRDYSDQEVQSRRANRHEPVFQRCLHDYVLLYLIPRNPNLSLSRPDVCQHRCRFRCSNRRLAINEKVKNIAFS